MTNVVYRSSCQVLAVILLSVNFALVIDLARGYQPVDTLFETLQNDAVRPGHGQESSLALNHNKENIELGEVALSLEKEKAELEDLKDSLDNWARLLATQVEQLPLMAQLTSAPVQDALRQVLSSKGFSVDEIDDILEEALHRLQFRHIKPGKRAWNKFSVQPRFAPFGTKLVPNRKLENGGATLLRYGRSSSSH